ncbi:hypothetical protein KBC86_00235 [Candidatus Gracilibacteria bacterium]|nr:hypothetical protein [Candidatus Gracilibacteria bacterium]
MADLKKTAASLKAGATNTRNTKSTRIWFMILLLAIIVLLFLLGIIKKGFAIGLAILILAAIGIETFNYDLDLGKLWETGDIQASRVQHTKEGLKIMGSCVKPVGNDANELDCNNFSSQAEAQAKYDQCADDIASYNDGVDVQKVKSLDLYGLDGNKNGIVCESLSGTPTIVEDVTLETEATGGTVEPTTTPPVKTTTSRTRTPAKTDSKSSPPVYSPTPVLNSDKPFPITEATVRTNPKVLPAQ